MLVKSDSMFEKSTGCFLHVCSLLYCCINWALRQVSPDRLQNVLQLRSVGRLWCVTLVHLEHRIQCVIIQRIRICRPLVFRMNSVQLRLK